MDVGELRSPNKIGHSNDQKLAKNSGLVADDEMPAVGWLDNLRVEEVDGINKLLADLKAVPKKLAALIKAGAFRTRSVEISRLTSQTDKKKYEVISGLAWLGAKAPAVRTLNDIIALYSEGQSEPAAALMLSDDSGEVGLYIAADYAQDVSFRVLDLSEGDVIWNPDGGMNALMSKLRMALNEKYPGTGEYASGAQYWIMDVARNGKTAIVEDYSSGETWLVAFSADDDGEIEISDKDEWTLARPAWVESSRELREDLTADATVSQTASDTRGQMADDNRTEDLTDEQVAAVAETLGIENDDPEELRKTVFERFAPEEPKVEPVVVPAPAPTPTPVASMSDAEVEVLKLNAEAGKTALRKLFEQERDTDISKALADGRIPPADEEKWQGFYEKDQAHTRELLAALPVNEEWKRVYGSNESGLDPQSQSDIEDAAYRAYLEQQGVDTSNVLSLTAGGRD
jgi:hypothetical protein